MKFKILISLILITFKLFSQPYTRIFTDNAEWTLRYNDSIRVIKVLGDTVSNGKQYKVLNTLSNNFKLGHSYVREDSAARKCWVLNSDKVSERILYNFNLNVSDTITFLNKYNLNPAQFYFTVDSVCAGNCTKIFCEYIFSKSITIKSNLKIFFFSGSSFAQTFQYIEGVGSIFGPLYLDDPIHCGDNIGNCVNSIPDLICCKKGSEIIYLKDCYKSCDTPLVFKSGGGGVNENKHLQSGLIVNPNPAKDFVIITSSKFTNLKYTIIDAYGKEVLHGNLETKETKIDIHELNKGIYFIRMGESDMKVLKFVKEE